MILSGDFEELSGARALESWLMSMFPSADLTVIWLRDQARADRIIRAAKKYQKIENPWFRLRLGGDEKKPVRLIVQSADGPRETELIIQFPAMLDRWGLTGFRDTDILAAMGSYWTNLGVEPLYNPAGVGLHSLWQSIARRPYRRENTTIHPSGGMDPFFSHNQAPLYWSRPFVEGEGPFLHAFDKKAAYLHACDGDMGIGDWERYTYRANYDPIETENPGLWRIQFHGGRPVYIGDGEWFYTPMLRAFRALDVDFHVIEGWYFPFSRRVFRDWRANILRSLDGSQALREMAKRTYTQAFGLLGSKMHSAGTRPDWRNLVIAEHNKRMMMNIQKIFSLSGQVPVGIYDDCLYYASDSPFNCAAGKAIAFDERLADKYKDGGLYDLRSAPSSLLSSVGTFIRQKEAYCCGGNLDFQGDSDAVVYQDEGVSDGEDVLG
jgi:hypothetical protein